MCHCVGHNCHRKKFFLNDERSILDSINKFLFSLFAFPDIFCTACVFYFVM